MVYCWVAEEPAASTTFAVNVLAPAGPVGVPLIKPVAPPVPVPLMFKPAGRDPGVMDQV
jgi:hypothetical protein